MHPLEPLTGHDGAERGAAAAYSTAVWEITQDCISATLLLISIQVLSE